MICAFSDALGYQQLTLAVQLLSVNMMSTVTLHMEEADTCLRRRGVHAEDEELHGGQGLQHQHDLEQDDGAGGVAQPCKAVRRQRAAHGVQDDEREACRRHAPHTHTSVLTRGSLSGALSTDCAQEVHDTIVLTRGGLKDTLSLDCAARPLTGVVVASVDEGEESRTRVMPTAWALSRHANKGALTEPKMFEQARGFRCRLRSHRCQRGS